MNQPKVANTPSSPKVVSKPEETTKTEEPKTTPGDRPRNHKIYDISNEPAHQFNVEDAAKLAIEIAESIFEIEVSVTNQHKRIRKNIILSDEQNI